MIKQSNLISSRHISEIGGLQLDQTLTHIHQKNQDGYTHQQSPYFQKPNINIISQNKSEKYLNSNHQEKLSQNIQLLQNISIKKQSDLLRKNNYKIDHKIYYTKPSEALRNKSKQKRIVIQQSAPSIPYRDSTFGYEPIDEQGKLLVNIGESFKQSLNRTQDSQPGPGAYEIANEYLQHRKKNYVLNYKNDTSKRSDIVNKNSIQEIGPGSYNIQNIHQQKNGSVIGSSSFIIQQKDQNRINFVKDQQLFKNLSSQNQIQQLVNGPSFKYEQEQRNIYNSQLEYGPAPSMELYTVREAVNGKYVQTKKMSKLSKYYMDNFIQKKEEEMINSSRLYKRDRSVLENQLSRQNSLLPIIVRNQSLNNHRRSTVGSRLPDQNEESYNSNLKDQSPGPGYYIDIYKNSSFKKLNVLNENKIQELNKYQEFGSQSSRFNGPEENQRLQKQHLGPGCYDQSETERMSQLKNKIYTNINEKLDKNKGFGSLAKNEERYLYIKENQSARMQTPGKYSYVDKRKDKKSHNKKNKNIFTSQTKRFEGLYRVNNIPGPGAYQEHEFSLLSMGKILPAQSQQVMQRAQSIESLQYQPINSIQSDMMSQHSLINDENNKMFIQSQSVRNLHADGKLPRIISKDLFTNKQKASELLLQKDFSKLFNSAQKLQLINNKAILDTKRGKNNQYSVFLKPQFTNDPSKQKLERVFKEDPVANSRVPVGTYDVGRYNSLGSQDLDDELLKKLKAKQFSLFENEIKNKNWINKARKNYMSKFQNDSETVEQFIKASGF